MRSAAQPCAESHITPVLGSVFGSTGNKKRGGPANTAPAKYNSRGWEGEGGNPNPALAVIYSERSGRISSEGFPTSKGQAVKVRSAPGTACMMACIQTQGQLQPGKERKKEKCLEFHSLDDIKIALWNMHLILNSLGTLWSAKVKESPTRRPNNRMRNKGKLSI